MNFTISEESAIIIAASAAAALWLLIGTLVGRNAFKGASRSRWDGFQYLGALGIVLLWPVALLLWFVLGKMED